MNGTSSSAVAVPARLPVPTPFTPRLAAGLSGVLLAVLVASFNERVTDLNLSDLCGALGIGSDEGTWVTTWYAAFSVSAMAFAPWFSGTFSIRRFASIMAIALAVLALLSPFMPDLESFIILRAFQGLAGGALPPTLMTVALRFLPAKFKIYGLGAYALTATFGPNIALPLAALCFDHFGWRGVLWQPIPLSLISAALIWWGIPQDPLRLERFRQFDWLGILLGFPAIGMLVVLLMQGDRLDWLNSDLICHLLVGSLLLFGLFVLNEWHHPSPFFRIQLLKSRELSFGLVALTCVLTLAVANLELPATYLAEIQDYRTTQLAPIGLYLALPQLLTLPLVAAICNTRRVDSRWVLCAGIALTAGSFWGISLITSEWIRENFYLLQALQVLAQPMIVIPVLVTATMSLAPADGPFVSGMFNVTKGLSSAIATGFVGTVEAWREHTHSNQIVDRYGSIRSTVSGFDTRVGDLLKLSGTIKEQAIVLTIADVSLMMVGVAGLLFILTILLPARVYPPSPPQAVATR
ncbi:MFS transporter [Rhizobium panacihumi]|uniref:MFS transporter n=1 Tax=Rhizobium panacihumi TaxID=2008450 RepID=UPI003D7AF157